MADPVTYGEVPEAADTKCKTCGESPSLVTADGPECSGCVDPPEEGD